MSVIEVKDVSIRYLRGDVKTIGLKELVVRKIKGTYKVQEFWADKDINFKLEKGDFLGIIGTNGAGKSTLLKAITGVMEPTKGVIHHEGKISSLLELSGGFDPYLTVRENTFLRGALLGYTRAFLNEKYDEIIQFAELEDFQDYSFRQLSSGMKSRLAFSVASLLQPDILILDEVLTVGDAAFRKKSENKMREIMGSGITVLMVNHGLGPIRALSTKILWLNKGEQVEFTDDVQGACDRYQAFIDEKIAKQEKRKNKTVKSMEKGRKEISFGDEPVTEFTEE